MVPGTNWSGTVIFFGSFLAAIGVGKLSGNVPEGPLISLGGALVCGLDLLSRLCWLKCGLWDRERGATLLFIPIWTFGLFWIVLGLIYTLVGAT
jgi:hypothetical protein